jgi:hypothetical protein
VDVFLASGLQHDGIDVLPCGGGRFHLVEQVETVMLVWMIEEEDIRVFVVDVKDVRWNILAFNLWLSDYGTHDFLFIRITLTYLAVYLYTRIYFYLVPYHHVILYFLNYTHTTVFVNLNATWGNGSVSKYTLVLFFPCKYHTTVDRTLWHGPLLKITDSHIFYHMTHFIAFLDSSHQALSNCQVKLIISLNFYQVMIN